MRQLLLLAIYLLCICTVANAASVDTIQVMSSAMHKKIKVVIILPEHYHQSSTQSFPVVYLLHGYSDNYAGWAKKAPNILRAADNTNAIVVCPDGGYGSWYFDSNVDTTYRYETFVSQELVSYIDGHYHSDTARTKRAIAGLSMGGHGALYLAIRHQNIYGAAASMSGGVDFTPFPNNWDIAKYLGPYNNNKQLWVANTVQYLVHSLSANSLAISFECGVDDFFIGVNRTLHDTLLSLHIPHDYAERPGEHNWKYWNNAIQYQMLFFKNYFSKEKL